MFLRVPRDIHTPQVPITLFDTSYNGMLQLQSLSHRSQSCIGSLQLTRELNTIPGVGISRLPGDIPF